MVKVLPPLPATNFANVSILRRNTLVLQDFYLVIDEEVRLVR